MQEWARLAAETPASTAVQYSLEREEGCQGLLVCDGKEDGYQVRTEGRKEKKQVA